MVVFIGGCVPEADGNRGHCLFPQRGEQNLCRREDAQRDNLQWVGTSCSSRAAQPGKPGMMLEWQGDITGTQQAPFSWVMFCFGRGLQPAGLSLGSKQDQPNADWCVAVTGSEGCKKGLTAKHPREAIPTHLRALWAKPCPDTPHQSHPLAGTRKMDRNGIFLKFKCHLSMKGLCTWCLMGAGKLFFSSPWQWAALMKQFPCNLHKPSGQ